MKILNVFMYIETYMYVFIYIYTYMNQLLIKKSKINNTIN